MGKEPMIMLTVAGQNYLALYQEDGLWLLFLVDPAGSLIDANRPAAFALTAGEAWTFGVTEAAALPIDELVIVAADAQGRIGKHLLSALAPIELIR